MPTDGEVGNAGNVSSAVFLSYRRQDAAFQADSLYRVLAATFGPEHVFKDVDSIEPGDDFAFAIARAVASCNVLLVVIGDRWLSAADPHGNRRLDDPKDFVRLEIESAFRAGIRVVPVLVGAELPAPEHLPPSLAPLAGRQAVFLSPNGFVDGAKRFVHTLARLSGPPSLRSPLQRETETDVGSLRHHEHVPSVEVRGSASQTAIGSEDGTTPVWNADLLDTPQQSSRQADVVLGPESELLSIAYRLQVADIAPATLRGRDAELDRLAVFCAGTQQYAWWQAEAWAGKTALMAWFVLHPPAGVVVASFFVAAGLAGQCDSDAFLEAMTEQLTVLAGRPPGKPATTATRRGRLLELLRAGSQRCLAAGRRLVLVVDGLDEDSSPVTGKQSIASLLPRRPTAGLHIVVTSRPERELSIDVAADHPLRRCIPERIGSFQGARDVELFAKRELAAQLGSSALHEDLLGLIAASGGGLSRVDLAELTGRLPNAVNELMRGSFGHSVQSRRQRLAGSAGAAGSSRGYLFAHDTLRQLAEQEFGPRLANYRDRLHDWALSYHERRWPTQTPVYLLRDYPRILAMTGNLDRLSVVACDPARHERMLELTGGDALALDETALAQTAVLARHPPDLTTAAALALRREELTRRNTIVPVDLPAVWAALGDIPRAESLACSATGAGRRDEALASAALAAATTGDIAGAEILIDRISSAERRDRALAAVATEAARTNLPHAQRLAARLPPGSFRDSTHIGITATQAAADPTRADALMAGIAENRRSRARTEFAVSLARAGHPAAAEALINAAGTGRPGAQPPARARVAVALARAGAFAAAERVAAPIRAPLIRARTLADLVAATAPTTDPSAATHLLTDLRSAARQLSDPGTACDILLPTATMLIGKDLQSAAADLARLAEELLERTEGHDKWVTARRAIARAAAGDWTSCTAALQLIRDPDTVAWTTKEIALSAEAAGAHDRTAALIATIPGLRRRADVFTALARAAVARGDRTRATNLAQAAERTARSGTNPGRLAAAADHIIDGLLTLGALDKATDLAQRITEPDRRESSLGRVAAALTISGHIQRARDLIGGLKTHRRAWGLAHIAHHLSDNARDEAIATAKQTLGMLPGISDGFSRTAILIKLAHTLIRTGDTNARSLLRRADTEATALTDPDRHARALIMLAIAAGELELHEWSTHLQRQAETLLDSINEESIRSRVHARFAEGLAEAGHLAAAEHHLQKITAPAVHVRATCAVAAKSDPTHAELLLHHAASLIPTIASTEDRHTVYARLAVTAATLAHKTGQPTNPALTLQPVTVLLTSSAWSLSAPALAYLEPDAFHVLAAWVADQLNPPNR